MDDVEALRSDRLGAEVLGVVPAAASTVGTFLRGFMAGHVLQLDAVQEDLLQQAWEAGARPQEPTLKLDLDSTVIDTYGLLKQGGKPSRTSRRAATTHCGDHRGVRRRGPLAAA